MRLSENKGLGIVLKVMCVLLRKSGTEPLIRVMVESVDSFITQVQPEYIAEAIKMASE